MSEQASAKYIQDEIRSNMLTIAKVSAHISSKPVLFGYNSRAVREAIVERRKQANIPAFHIEFMPDFTKFQYDLEIYIFLNYDKLLARELELQDGKRLSAVETTRSATLMPRQFHLEQAYRIRWTEKILPSGVAVTGYAITPWSRDYLYAFSNYKNIVSFGGGGQGKTFNFIAFSLVMWEYFYYTKSGGQASFSTVSELKLEKSIWSHLNKLASYKHDYQYSDTANLGIKGSNYCFYRKSRGKRVEEGGTMQGYLIQAGRTDGSQIDKLTGQHDVMCRTYVLDEAQSTGPAPMSAYNNMYIHPPYGWFMMAGNYLEDNDLLGVNVEPIGGWDSVDEFTHMWEGRLKSPESDLGHPSLVMHFNNNLSPAIPRDGATAEEIAKAKEYETKYPELLPTLAKKRSLYKTKESEEQIASKRFWIGFRFASVKQDNEPLITRELLAKSECDQKPQFPCVGKFATIDTASQVDRTLVTVINYGLDSQGFIQFWPDKIYPIRRPTSQYRINEETAAAIFEVMSHENIASGEAIMDWSNRTGILESLVSNHNFHCYPLIYQMAPPDGSENEIFRRIENPIEIDFTETADHAGMPNRVKCLAHQKFADRITLAAWLLRQYIDRGRMRNFNESLLDMCPGSKSFDKEFCLRYLYVMEKGTRKGRVKLDEKSDLCKKYKFSPDILDTLFQAAYFIGACRGVMPDNAGLGRLGGIANKVKKKVDNSRWNARLRFK